VTGFGVWHEASTQDMKAQERHHLKQNEFLETAVSMTGLLRDNRSRVAATAAAVIVLVAAVGGWLYWRTQKANEAGAALGIAMATAQAPVTPASTLPGVGQPVGTFPTEAARTEAAIKAFSDVATAFAGTEAGASASYQAASALLAAGRPAEAQAAFEKTAASGSAFYAPLARLGEAQALMAAGKHDDALKIYADLAAARDTSLPVDGVLMELARSAQKAGKAQDARAAFKRVVDEFPDSTYVSDAKQQLAALN
jgi:TolA-binding protein